jgi:hypothetical protein
LNASTVFLAHTSLHHQRKTLVFLFPFGDHGTSSLNMNLRILASNRIGLGNQAGRPSFLSTARVQSNSHVGDFYECRFGCCLLWSLIVADLPCLLDRNDQGAGRVSAARHRSRHMETLSPACLFGCCSGLAIFVAFWWLYISPWKWGCGPNDQSDMCIKAIVLFCDAIPWY